MADFVKNDKRNNNTNGKRNFNNNNRNNNRNGNNKPVTYRNNDKDVVTPPDVCAGTIEYKMGKLMAEEILRAAKGKSGKLPKPAQEILCNYVNSECGLKGYCVNVLVEVN